jgi:nitrous oxidase accessory protein
MRKNPLIGKWFAAGIILFFVGTCIIPAMAQNTVKPLTTSKGGWLYVGGSGPGNYTKIQDAIDNATDGDMIYVFSGMYNENLRIDKPLLIKGENENTTIINGNGTTPTIFIDADTVQIMDFTATNSLWTNTGVEIYNADHCRITHTIVLDCDCSIRLEAVNENTIDNNTLRGEHSRKYGIELLNSGHNHIQRNEITNTNHPFYLEESTDNILSKNILIQNGYGIWLEESQNNSILENTITLSEHFCILIKSSKNNLIMNNRISDNAETGIWLEGSQGNRIQENHINNNQVGILILESALTVITGNEISHNRYGIYLETAYMNRIMKNNIVDNDQNALFRNAWVNRWHSNYWKPHLLGPKIIQGTLFKVVQKGWGYEQVDLFTLYKFDWHPAQEPYDNPQDKKISGRIEIQTI